jgi:DNA-binding LacI/PurR family transcriptional regulator
MAVTQDDVAERAGVSRGAVSLALRNSPRISKERRAEILQAAAELGYRPNAHAAHLASHHSMTLGLVMNEMDNPLTLQILRCAQNRADGAGWGVMISADSGTTDAQRTAVDHFLAHRVDGIVMLGTRLDSGEVRRIAQQVPLVVVNRRIRGVDAVSVDDAEGANLAVEHLLQLGHRRIAHVDGGEAPGAAIRRSTYLRAMEAHGLKSLAHISRGDNTEPGGVEAGRQLLHGPKPPTAIFAANDLSAIGVMAVARDLGMDIPRDISVVGFDDTALSSMSYVNLTTISQPDELGAVAVDRVISRISDPSVATKWILLRPELRIRRTTAGFSGQPSQGVAG